MYRRAFTLVELLVVISIIGLLSTIAVVSLGSARMNARNTQRKTNLTQVAKALEFYYNDNGVYPSTGGASSWHGECSGYGSYPNSGAGAWIPNFQNYMALLPHDPNTNIANPGSANPGCGTSPGASCFLYTSNSTDYKLIVHCSPEGTMSATDPYYDPARATWGWAQYSPGARLW